MSRFWKIALMIPLLLAACAPAIAPASPTSTALPTLPPTPTSTAAPTSTPLPTPTAIPLVPNFAHIVIVVFENKEFGSVIGRPNMPYFNVLAQTNTLLTQHYAVTHPSLPNYIALVSGDTHGITANCEDCFIAAPSLADQVEASGRTWKTYQQSMPSPCFLGSTLAYAQKHNPFIYFDSIRLDAARCNERVVPLDQLDVDIATRTLPNFIFITPNLCYSSHDCALELADAWLNTLLDKLVPALDATAEPYLLVLTWDEGQGNHSCCGLAPEAGGRVATVLVSPQAKRNFQDDTPYSHYSLLKTIEEAWNLPYLGHAADGSAALILRPWK
ncbi:MAG: alkaline phosphatase family protein [Chloroflexota bacterium]